ncbi:HAD family hydrolase [Enteractinococcus helveticum]|uniref:Haloacid dehalogenase n=1 Tax=Enteractinococcus helveticum TaxID=1837282 RepID=A0A1B7M1K8_9MICC|nr:HAD-IA family hydrolase [Enteractinococcus helveticum]OAV62445.1 hypothetical protein A6F49_06985 [Enteractinococcus helveticum]
MNNTQRPGIIFDLEGTLLMSEDVVSSSLDQAISNPVLHRRWEHAELRDPSTTLMRARGSRQIFLSSMEDSYITPFAGIDSMLRRLQQDYALAVVSNARKEIVDILLRKSGLAQYFETVVSIDDVALGKPDPEGIHVACARLGTSAYETLIVGDTTQDASAAQRAGSLFVLAQWQHNARKDAVPTSSNAAAEYKQVTTPNELEALCCSGVDSRNSVDYLSIGPAI